MEHKVQAVLWFLRLRLIVVCVWLFSPHLHDAGDSSSSSPVNSKSKNNEESFLRRYLVVEQMKGSKLWPFSRQLNY